MSLILYCRHLGVCMGWIRWVGGNDFNQFGISRLENFQTTTNPPNYKKNDGLVEDLGGF